MNCYRHILFGIVFLTILTGCMIGSDSRDKKLPIDSQSTLTPERPFFKANRKTSFEDEGKFIMIEGSQCVQREQGPASATMLIMVDMPNYTNQGTVILNGWELRYLNQDHEVRSLRADITHSKLVSGAGGSSTLVFEVEGELSDQDWDDAYEFCVYYTGFGFNSAWIDARIEGDYEGIESQAIQTQTEGPIATQEISWDTGSLKSNDSIAIIPRGFHFQYDNTFECEWRILPCRWNDSIDHRLRQVAYSLFQTDASPNPDNNPHWILQTIFKDNHTRTYRMKTRTALIGGNSVKLHADFLPLQPQSGKAKICRNDVDGVVRTKTFRIHDLPYDYAVPMLTGWDLNYECQNQQVQRTGIWIHDFHFDSDANELEYKVSSIMRDRDGAPSFNSKHRVSVLGFNRSPAPPVANRPAPKVKIKLRKQ